MLKEVNLEELGKMEMLEDVDVSENARLERLGRSAESSSSSTDDGYSRSDTFRGGRPRVRRKMAKLNLVRGNQMQPSLHFATVSCHRK